MTRRQMSVRKSSFKKRLDGLLKKTDTSRNSPYEVMRRYLVELLSSERLYQEVAKRDNGLCLAYVPCSRDYKLGLATGGQIKRVYGVYLDHSVSEDEENEKRIIPKRGNLALVETENLKTYGDYLGILMNVLTPSTLLNKDKSISAIKYILEKFSISPRTLEKKIFEAVSNIDTEEMFDLI